MKYKIVFNNGDTRIIEAKDCRQSGGGLFRRAQWYDFGEEKISDRAVDVRDTYFRITARFNIDDVRSVEAVADE